MYMYTHAQRPRQQEAGRANDLDKAAFNLLASCWVKQTAHFLATTAGLPPEATSLFAFLFLFFFLSTTQKNKHFSEFRLKIKKKGAMCNVSSSQTTQNLQN